MSRSSLTRIALLASASVLAASPAHAQAVGGDLGGFIQEILSNCAVELAFAPKELRLANELSDRLGYMTVRSPSRSRPSGLSRGHRSISESDQRRALMLPQELMQLPPEDMLVLRAGLPPIRARKIRHYHDQAFRTRVSAPPEIPCLPPWRDEDAPEAITARNPDPLTLEALAPLLEAEGFEPVPPDGASPAEIDAWVTRFIDASQNPLPGGPQRA